MSFSTIKELTRLEHSLFALPFVLASALLSMILLGSLDDVIWMNFIWILPATIIGRISGMAFNQLIDRYIDADNPRTAGRPLPSMRIQVRSARLIAWSSLALLLFICFQISPLCAYLGLFAALFIYLYSYMKRIHASCHFILGMVHFLGVVMASIALINGFSISSILLGLAAFSSISGNDIAYAIQDIKFDIAYDLHSLPARIGTQRSLAVAGLLHLIVFPLALLGVGLTAHLPLVYYLCIPSTLWVFARFHRAIKSKIRDTGDAVGLEKEFFSCGVQISLIVLAFISLSFVMRIL